MNIAEQADMIVNISRRIENLESRLSYTATTIATLAAGDEMDNSFFTNAIAEYRAMTNELAAEKRAYADVLNA